MNLGPLEIILLIVVIALIFGARKLPELGKGLGRGIKEFRSEVRDPATSEPATRERPPITDVPSRQLDLVTGTPMPERTGADRQADHATERRS